MLKKILLALALLATPALADTQNVGGFDDGRSVSLNASAASHSASQALGNWIKLNIFRTTSPPSAIFDNVMVGSQSGLTTGVTVYVLDTAPVSSNCSDGVAFALSNADAYNLVFSPLSLTPATSQGATPTTAQATPSGSPVSAHNHDTPATTYAYVCVVANGTMTPATTGDLWVRVSAAQD